MGPSGVRIFNRPYARVVPLLRSTAEASAVMCVAFAVLCLLRGHPGLSMGASVLVRIGWPWEVGWLERDQLCADKQCAAGLQEDDCNECDSHRIRRTVCHQ